MSNSKVTYTGSVFFKQTNGDEQRCLTTVKRLWETKPKEFFAGWKMCVHEYTDAFNYSRGCTSTILFDEIESLEILRVGSAEFTDCVRVSFNKDNKEEANPSENAEIKNIKVNIG